MLRGCSELLARRLGEAGPPPAYELLLRRRGAEERPDGESPPVRLCQQPSDDDLELAARVFEGADGRLSPWGAAHAFLLHDCHDAALLRVLRFAVVSMHAEGVAPAPADGAHLRARGRAEALRALAVAAAASPEGRAWIAACAQLAGLA